MSGTTYALVASGAPVNPAEIERDDVDIAEVILSWGDAGSRSVLSARHIERGARITAGEAEGCQLFIPAEVLGASVVELVTFDGARATVTSPAGGTARVDGVVAHGPSFEIGRGQVADIAVGAFSVRVTVSAAGRRHAGSMLDSMKQSGLGGVGASAFLHAALFASVALFMPALGESDAEAMERDQILTMQRYLNASAEAERERLEADTSGGAPDVSAPDPTPSGGQRAAGSEGAMGKPTNAGKGRWSLAGDAKPSEVTLPREQQLAMAAGFGMIGLLATSEKIDPNAPVVPWGGVASGSDRESHFGNLWGATIDDAFGLGIGVSGNEEGGGGKGMGIGVNDIGGLGRSLDTRIGSGGDRGGIGGCGPGRPCGPGVGGAHKSTFTMRMPPTIETNGRLLPEIIQRIVRLNQGRFRTCYETALGKNPSLEGRVAVKFVIDRSGGVSIARDSGSDLPDDGVRTCVVRSFYNLSFPAPSGGTVTVTYPIMFTPAS